MTTYAHEDYLMEEIVQEDVEMMKQMTIKNNLEQKLPHIEGIISTIQGRKYHLLKGMCNPSLDFLLKVHYHHRPLQRGCLCPKNLNVQSSV